MKNIKVAIMMGSKSDLPIMEETAKLLKSFEISYDMKVLSAHRTPKETAEYSENLKGNGVQVVVCGAGMAAALAGVVAAHTDLPVIGVPIEGAAFNGMDALLSTVQMPPGIPVGTVAVGKVGAKNAALLAVRIMALSDDLLAEKLKAFKEEQKKKILDTDIS